MLICVYIVIIGDTHESAKRKEDALELGRRFKERYERTEAAARNKKLEIPKRSLEETMAELKRYEEAMVSLIAGVDKKPI